MIAKLFKEGIEKQIAEHAENEKAKMGTLRGGSVGMIDEDGNILGSCAAEAYLRFKGFNLSSPDLNKELMYSGGRLNEDHWLSVLKESYKGPILCEEEIATHWKTENGISVTGRPDIVLGNYEVIEDIIDDKFTDPAFIPKCLIELKQIMSVYMVKEILLEQRPSLKHLMQAAHYMWQLDCQGELWYTQRNNLDLPDWFTYFNKTPRADSAVGMELFKYRYYRLGKINARSGKPTRHKSTQEEYMANLTDRNYIAEPSKITPFIRGFKLKLLNGRLYYQQAGNAGAEWKETIITIANIKRWYEYLSELELSGKVPKEYINVQADGSEVPFKFDSDLEELAPGTYKGKKLDTWFKKVKDKFK